MNSFQWSSAAPLVKIQVFRVHAISTNANGSILLYFWLTFCFEHQS